MSRNETISCLSFAIVKHTQNSMWTVLLNKRLRNPFTDYIDVFVPVHGRHMDDAMLNENTFFSINISLKLSSIIAKSL